jgi:ATP-dependent Clp protease ATP-binding subunit ClpX
VIGQPELTTAAADFLYYHAMRQVNQELPLRPMIISGPSGSGKTEVWRAIKQLYGEIFHIHIADGSSITADGWNGKNKLYMHLTPAVCDGGILIVDEFDKMASPAVGSGGTNHSEITQAEFLKLLEGEYSGMPEDPTKQAASYTQLLRSSPMSLASNSNKYNRLGVVLVGAFEKIRDVRQSRVGFNKDCDIVDNKERTIQDAEYISFGVLPELIGRIAIKVTTNHLTDQQYVDIVRSPHSRLTKIIAILKEFGLPIEDGLTDEELKALIATSKANRTGVRWVSSQAESAVLAKLHAIGVKFELEQREETGEEDLGKTAQEPKEDNPIVRQDDEFFF